MTIEELITRWETALAQHDAAKVIEGDAITDMRLAISQYRDELEIVVRPGELIQTALNDAAPGRRVRVQAGSYLNPITITKPVMLTLDQGVNIETDATSILHVRPQVNDVTIVGGYLRGRGNDLVLIGQTDNTQTTAEAAPRNIRLQNVIVDGRLGAKRGFSVHAHDWELLDCETVQIGRAGQESQGIATWNGPGNGRVIGGTYEAASINILLGGAFVQIPGMVQQGVHVIGAQLHKQNIPATGYAVKNLYEVKFGIHSVLENCRLFDTWSDGQDGFAIVIKCENPGSMPWADTGNTIIRNNWISNVTGGINVQGHGYARYCMNHVKDVLIVNNVFTISRTVRTGQRTTGPGDFLKLGNEPENVIVRNNTIRSAGDTLVRGYRGTKMLQDGSVVRADPSRGFVFNRNAAPQTTYGFFTEGEDRQNRSNSARILEYFPDGQITENFYGDVLALYDSDGYAINSGTLTGRQR